MTTVVWLVPGAWRACVDAVADGPDRDLVLVAVADDEAAAVAAGAAGGLLGRGRPRGTQAAMGLLTLAAAQALLADAAAVLGGCRTQVLRGRPEHAVVAAAQGADLLVMARDGDPRPGPHSLGRAGRFVVDHATCPVLLVPAR